MNPMQSLRATLVPRCLLFTQQNVTRQQLNNNTPPQQILKYQMVNYVSL